MRGNTIQDEEVLGVRGRKREVWEMLDLGEVVVVGGLVSQQCVRPPTTPPPSESSQIPALS